MLDFVKRLFTKKETKRVASSGGSGKSLVRCPGCEKTFENKMDDNPVDALAHAMMSTSGEEDTSGVSEFLGIKAKDFNCPYCGKRFRL